MSQDNTTDSCNSASDCSTDGVPRTCYGQVPWSERENFCDCSNWWGFIGENCDVPGVTTQYQKVSASLLGLTALPVFLSLSGLLIYTLVIRKRLGPKLIDQAFWTVVAACAGSLCIMLFSISQLLALFDVTGFHIVTRVFLGGEVEEVQVIFDRMDSGALNMAVAFNSLGILQICVSWGSLIHSLGAINYFVKVTRLMYYQKLANAATFILLIVTIGAVSAEAYVLCVVPSVILLMVLAPLILYNRRNFVFFVEKVVGADIDKYSGALKLVIVTSRLILFCISILVFLSFFYYIPVLNKENVVAVGQFNFILLAQDLIVLFGLLSMSVQGWYGYNIIMGKKNNNGKFATSETATFVPRSSVMVPEL